MRVHSLENHDSPSLLAFLFNFNMDVIHVCIRVAHCTPSPPPCQISESREEEQNQKTLLVQKAISKSLVGSTVDENVLLLGRPSCDCIRGAPETTTFSLTVSLCLSLVCLVFPDQSAVFSQIFFIL